MKTAAMIVVGVLGLTGGWWGYERSEVIADVTSVTSRLETAVSYEAGEALITHGEAMQRLGESVDHAERVALGLRERGADDAEAYVRAAQGVLRATWQRHYRYVKMTATTADATAQRLRGGMGEDQIDATIARLEKARDGYIDAVRQSVGAITTLRAAMLASGLPDRAMVADETLAQWKSRMEQEL